ncbi:MAG: hypothetical protein ABSE20_00865 [Acetobacteraceae bacterium]|jgi:hypothetical protein
MLGAWLVVRAAVADPDDRAAFDTWYRQEHLPDAVKAFSANAAWRGWSSTDPSIHCAYYRFESLEQLDAVMAGPAIKDLIAEFDRCWLGRVTRTREVVAVADEFEERRAG